MNSFLVLMPFFGVILLNLPFKALMRKAGFWLALALSIWQVSVVIFGFPFSGEGALKTVDSLLRLDFRVDDLSRLLLLCIGIVTFVALIVQRHAPGDDAKKLNFTSLILIAMSGMNGTVMVRDIFSLYLFIEITAVASFILISSDKNMPAFEGAFKYMILSAVAGILMLSSIALIFLVAGGTGFSEISSALKNSAHGLLIMFAVGLFICGLFIKAGLMPFHGWVPDSYSWAPAPVSVLLAGVVTKAVGMYTLMRMVISIFGFDNPTKQILLAVGAFSVVLGALAALGQSDFKRMLAYSSISQMGYIVMGLGCGTALGIAGAAFHLFNHAIFKSLLFVNSAAVESQTGTRDMNKMGGLAAKMPITGVTSVLASLSTAGIPPLSGFWSKLIIIIALWMSGYYAYAVIAVLASVITLAYFLSLQRRVFFGKLRQDFVNVEEAGFGLVFVSFVLAAITVGAGLLFPFILNSFIFPVAGILGG